MKKFAVAAVLALGFVSMSGAFVKANPLAGQSCLNDTVKTDTVAVPDSVPALADTVTTDTATTAEPAFALNDTIVQDTVKA